MRVSVFVLVLISASAVAQLAFQAPSSTYDGQQVSAVSLIANPHRDLQTLDRLVTQHAGEPYSQKKIDADAEALEQAGQFPKVEVSVVPEVAGLRVEFLLEPAYYLGMVEFSRSTKSFSYTRLLQTADLSDEDPYDPSRIPVAEKALTSFLRRNGFFQADVHAQPVIDDAHQLVNVDFAINLGNEGAHCLGRYRRAG